MATNKNEKYVIDTFDTGSDEVMPTDVEMVTDAMTTVNNLLCTGFNLVNVNNKEKHIMVNSENGYGKELNDEILEFAQILEEEDPEDVDMRPPFCMANDNLSKFIDDISLNGSLTTERYTLQSFVKSLVPGLNGLIDQIIKIAVYYNFKQPQNLKSLYLPCGNDQCWGLATLHCTANQTPKLPILRNWTIYDGAKEPCDMTKAEAKAYLSGVEESIKSERGLICGICAVYAYFGTDFEKNNKNIGWEAFPAIHKYFFRSLSTHELPYGNIINDLVLEDYGNDGAYCIKMGGNIYT